MKLYLRVIIILLILISFPFTSYPQKFDKDDKIKIGFVLDGQHHSFLEIVSEIKHESDVLLGTKYKKLKFPDEKLWCCPSKTKPILILSSLSNF